MCSYVFRYDTLVVTRHGVPGVFGLYFIRYFLLSSIIILFILANCSGQRSLPACTTIRLKDSRCAGVRRVMSWCACAYMCVCCGQRAFFTLGSVQFSSVQFTHTGYKYRPAQNNAVLLHRQCAVAADQAARLVRALSVCVDARQHSCT